MSKTAQASPIINGCSAAWEQFLAEGDKRKVAANITLLHAGENVNHLYYLQKGEVLISHFAAPDTVTRLFLLREQSMLGLIGLFSSVQPMASWLTLSPCLIYMFSKEYVLEKAPRHLLVNLLEQFGVMSSCMSRRFSRGNNKRHEVRLARLLIHLADMDHMKENNTGSGISIMPRVTQEMVSELLGMHPVTLSKLLGIFRAEGIVGKFTKKRLDILDLDALYKYASGVMPPLNTS